MMVWAGLMRGGGASNGGVACGRGLRVGAWPGSTLPYGARCVLGGRGLIRPRPLFQAAPGGEAAPWAGGGEETSGGGDFGAFYQSEESFAGPAPLYGSAYLKAAPPPGPALSGSAPSKGDGSAPGM